MMRKRIGLLLTAALLLLCCSFGSLVYAEESADRSALLAVLQHIECYEEADYTPASYSALQAVVQQYQPLADTLEEQAAIDAATAALMEAASDLQPYLRLTVAASLPEAEVATVFEDTQAGVGNYTVVSGTAVSVTAPTVEGYTFRGWLETVSKRYFAEDSSYTFPMTVNTSLRAVYYTDGSAVLTFCSESGQVFSTVEKTAEEWAQVTDLAPLAPESVPYRYGYTDGRWQLTDEVLARLQTGESVTVTPTYTDKPAMQFDAPEAAADTAVLALHYRHDAEKNVGSFVMKTALPEEITPYAVGMLFYYQKADDFAPQSFDVNINNKMLASQFDTYRDETYITNMKKIGQYRWAVKGYVTYQQNGKTVTVYSNQVNVVDGEDLHTPLPFSAVAATCTEDGQTGGTYCPICGEQLTAPETVPALGHDYREEIAYPTCTADGYTTYTCTRCDSRYTDNYTPALGHDMGEWETVTAPAVNREGLRQRSCSRCDYTETEVLPALEPVYNLAVKLPHTDAYLYRAGNANSIALSSLFTAQDESVAIDSNEVSLTVTKVAGTANGTYTADTADWRAGTVKFTGTGVVQLTAQQYGTAVATLYLEIVNGTNYAEGATLASITANNAVLLGDVNCKKITVNNGKTLYGNGFSVTDARTDFSGAANAYMTLNGGGALDNVRLLGTVYPKAVTSGQENQYYAPGVWITGDANIYNSYVSETKNAVQIDSGTVYFENTTFAGGALANIDIGGGDVTLNNCVTSTSDRGGLKGLGVRVKTANCQLHLLGTLMQYNYLTKSDLPSTYSSVMSSVYNDATFAYTNSGSTYVNMGIFFITDAGSITAAQAQAATDDRTGNNYGYLEKSVSSYTGTVYTLKAAGASASLLTAPVYDETVNGQYPIAPTATFDYTAKNYIAKTEGSNRYCYYDSTTKSVQLSFDKETDATSFTWDPMILTPVKNSNTLPYTVSMNGTDYTGKTIAFTESGEYTVTYTYTDPYNYSKDGTAFDKTYQKQIVINVTAVEPDDITYNAAFSYDGAAGSYAAKKVIGTDSKTYVMPDVSATSTTIGKTTVAGQTVYYPIVTVNPTSSNGNSAYSSGKIYYFAPVFSELHIIDYNQETGEKQYEYSKSTTTWPHGKSASSGPDTSVFTCASGEKTWSGTSPYGRNMNTQYYGYGKNNLGVCYTSNEIEKDNSASTHLVQYHYVSNDGTTYYYYVQYKFGAATYSSCVTDGTLVTMADGTQKPVEEIKVGDMVMTWSLWNGCYEAQPVTLCWYHGTQEWEVLTLHFSDGTAVRTIQQHGFFNADRNTYTYITPSNAAEYLGERFVKQAPDGTNTTVTLTDYTLQTETVGSYSLQTAYNDNFMVENMLSMTGEDHAGRFEYFAVGDGMQYDREQMQADIDRYGLYTYEDFAAYLTPEQFAMFNGAYFKVLVGRGVLTYNDILQMITVNLSAQS